MPEIETKKFKSETDRVVTEVFITGSLVRQRSYCMGSKRTRGVVSDEKRGKEYFDDKFMVAGLQNVITEYFDDYTDVWISATVFFEFLEDKENKVVKGKLKDYNKLFGTEKNGRTPTVKRVKKESLIDLNDIEEAINEIDEEA